MTKALDLARLRPPWARHASSVAPAESPPGAVTFPGVPLVGEVYIALGADLTKPPSTWIWERITPYVRFEKGIATTQGRIDWTAVVRTSSGALVLDNRDGRFSRRNPNSPYYGLLTLNTPIWATIDAGTGPQTRMQLFVNEWPKRWDRSATDSTVPIACAGIMRRLAQGEVLKSPLYRAISGAGPVAFWPLEDESSAVRAASALSGGVPLTVRAAGFTSPGVTQTVVTFGNNYPAIPGIARGPTFAGGLIVVNGDRAGTMTGPLSGMSATGFSFEFVGLNKGGGSPGAGSQVDVICSGPAGTIVKWIVRAPLDTSLATPLSLVAVDASNVSTTAASTSGFPDPALPHHYRVELRQSGSDVVGTFYVDGVGYPVSVIGKTLGVPYQVTLNALHNLANDDQITGTIVGLAFYNATTIASHFNAVNAYAGEQATTRIRRLASEEGVPMVCTSGVSPAMGVQPVGTLLDVLRDCEAVDMGVLYETGWGLGYRSLDDRINQPVSMALDRNLGHVAEEPQPADDDQRVRNKWTISRTGGSSAVAQQASGPLGTQPGGPGLYDDSTTLNVAADSQLSDQASWRLRFGQVDEDRWPNIPLRFHGTPDLIPAWLTLPYGARMTLANVASQAAPDVIDAIIEGWSERWDPTSWDATLNTAPYSPYRVVVVDDPAAIQDSPRVGSGTAALGVGINTTDASLSVSTGAGGLWTTNPADFPLDINIGGERIRLSSISGGSSPQTFTVSARSVNGVVKAQPLGSPVEVWQIATVGL